MTADYRKGVHDMAWEVKKGAAYMLAAVLGLALLALWRRKAADQER